MIISKFIKQQTVSKFIEKLMIVSTEIEYS